MDDTSQRHFVKPRVLFILKRGQGYGYSNGFSSGLINDAWFACEMLSHEQLGPHDEITTKCMEVIDNNDIAAAVDSFRPTVVIIEALWVVPEKIEELRKLYRSINWVVRLHSELPFLTSEVIAIEWLKAYAAMDKVFVGANSNRGFLDYTEIAQFSGLPAGKVLYLPTYYPAPRFDPKNYPHNAKTLNVICPGALRPFKNHINQAAGAMLYAEGHGKMLLFHVNIERVELGGEAVLANLRALFAGTRHVLVREPWLKHADFVALLRRMDMGMQVSFTETFNIAAADIVAAGLPLVASPQVTWASEAAQADPNDVRSIAQEISRGFKYANQILLDNVNSLAHRARRAKDAWIKALRSLA